MNQVTRPTPAYVMTSAKVSSGPSGVPLGLLRHPNPFQLLRGFHDTWLRGGAVLACC